MCELSLTLPAPIERKTVSIATTTGAFLLHFLERDENVVGVRPGAA
jgi:hypothetical protein